MDLNELKVLFEDNHLLIVWKPAGLLTEPSGTAQANLEQLCKQWLKEKYGKPGNVFLGAIHRLDKPVSGVVAFAKTSKALARLHASMRNRHVVKIYEAWVEGVPRHEEEVLEHYLRHDDFHAEVTSPSENGAKQARLHYRVIERKPGKTHLRIQLETGRYHQIRVQLASIGCPILGDRKYGGKMAFDQDEIALQHVEMHLPHPITQQTLTFSKNSIVS